MLQFLYITMFVLYQRNFQFIFWEPVPVNKLACYLMYHYLVRRNSNIPDFNATCYLSEHSKVQYSTQNEQHKYILATPARVHSTVPAYFKKLDATVLEVFA